MSEVDRLKDKSADNDAKFIDRIFEDEMLCTSTSSGARSVQENYADLGK